MRSIRIHPATIFFLLILLFTGFGVVIIPYLIAVILHELGHAYMAKKLGYKLNKIWILPYGAALSFEEYSFDLYDEIKIAFAGPIVNIILIILTMTCWWIFPEIYVYTYVFALANFSLALFNLLPAFPLDGGRILTSVLRTQFKTKTVYRTICLLNTFFSCVFLILFIVSCFYKINFSLGIIAIFLFIGIIEGKFQGKYSPMLYEFTHKKNKPLHVKSFCVTSSTPFFKIIPEINKHKYNIIYVRFPDNSLKMVNEKQFQNILEKHSLENCFEDL